MLNLSLFMRDSCSGCVHIFFPLISCAVGAMSFCCNLCFPYKHLPPPFYSPRYYPFVSVPAALFESLFKLSSHCLSLGLPLFHLPPSSACHALFGSLSMSILCTCPTHLILFISTCPTHLFCLFLLALPI